MTAEEILKAMCAGAPGNLEKAMTALSKVSGMSADAVEQMSVDAYNRAEGDLKDYDCPICKNKGFVAYLDDNKEYCQRRCSCMAKRRSIREAKASGMGALLSKTFENFETAQEHQKILYRTAREFVSSVTHGDICWMMACGQSGSGKTHICAAACNELLKDGFSVRYMSWIAESGRLRRLKTDDEAYNELYFQLQDPMVLYIDDLFKHSGDGKPSDAEIGLAFDVLNHRINAEKITVISTEYSIEMLRSMDEAITGRIVEMCKGNVVRIKPDINKNYRFKEFR